MVQVDPDVDGVAILRLEGELDIDTTRATEADIEDALVRLGDRPFVLSFERCAYCDSTGLSMLVRLHRQHDARFVVVAGAGTNVRRVLDVTGLGDLFRICDDVPTATRALAPAS